MIAIVDYNAGNITSVCNALKRLGAEWCLTADEKELQKASHILLPGVGDAAEVMCKLREKRLVEPIKAIRRPVLGICIGMQVLCRDSEESDAKCIGIFDSHVRRFPSGTTDKVPHMGWNSLHNLESKLFKAIDPGEYVYYVHSYRAELCPDTIATTSYCGSRFSAALKYENFYGTQFHPEKSGDVGERILKNFLEIC